MKAAVLLGVVLALIGYLAVPSWRAVEDLSGAAGRPYFPEGSGNELPDYCSGELRAMREPSLWKLSRGQKDAGYRFLFVPSFSQSFAVRVMRSSGGAELRLVELADESGSRRNRVRSERVLSLSTGQWADLDALAEKSGIWDMPSGDPSVVNDGAAFVVEGVRAGRYHGVHRQSPSPGPYLRFCHNLLALSGPGRPKATGDHEPLEVGLRRFALVRTRTAALAVRFVEHTRVGVGGSDYGGATYEWFLQADGSGDFHRDNVATGRGEVVGAPNYRPEQMTLACGPLILSWSPCYDDRDYVSVRRADCKVDRFDVIGLAASEWGKTADIEIDNKYLVWSHGE